MGKSCNIRLVSHSIAAFLLLGILQSCFTEVESTPKITYKDVKSSHADHVSPEQKLADSLSIIPFSNWEYGKSLYVTSSKISLALNDSRGREVLLSEGDTLVYKGSETNTDIIGSDIVDLKFYPKSDPETILTYRTNATTNELATRKYFAIPFTVDLDMIERADRLLSGMVCYIRTPLWYTPSGSSVKGTKFTPITITRVSAANEVYPYLVEFKASNGAECAVFMTPITETEHSSRDFTTLFFLNNPRKNYPQIKDDIWNKIIQSEVAEGMTKLEATLAWGAPSTIERGHDHSTAFERWIYPDGRYLLFEDAVLSHIRK